MSNSPVFPSLFDHPSYTRPIRLDAHHGVVLADQLVASAPSDLGARGHAELEIVMSSAARVHGVLSARVGTPGGLRPVLAAHDAAWGGLAGRISSAAQLPASGGDLGQRASHIRDVVFPDGLAFLRTDAITRYSESKRRLALIEEQRLGREIHRVAGAGFLDAVKTEHAALGDALGVGETPVRYTRAELQMVVGELATAISDYALQVAAETDRLDPESVTRFRKAMMPIDRFRSEHASAPSDTAPSTDATAPTTTSTGTGTLTSAAPAPTTSPSPAPSPAASPTNGAAHA